MEIRLIGSDREGSVYHWPYWAVQGRKDVAIVWEISYAYLSVNNIQEFI